ncbi:nitroreductase family protein [Candidatus Woesearchaeota archaeon]|nr:nitroreductase family protein [Candidatus Woesearchaeota archaeon]
MDAVECLKTRRSVRRFKDMPVPFELLGNILESARLAPSAGNIQEWNFIVVTDYKTRENISMAACMQTWMNDAPVHIVVCSNPGKSERFYGDKGEKLYCIQNSAAAIENILLAAHAQGLGACWVGACDEDKVRRIIGAPGNIRVLGIVPIGYSAEEPAMPDKYPLTDVVFIDKWGNRIKDIAAYMGYYGTHIKRAAEKGREIFAKIASGKNKSSSKKS